MQPHTNLDIAQSNSVYSWLAGVQPQDDPNCVEPHGSRPRQQHRADFQGPQVHLNTHKEDSSFWSQRRRSTRRDNGRLQVAGQSTPNYLSGESPSSLLPLRPRQGIDNGRNEGFDENTIDPYSAKTYGRKPRRKTRPNRYELKDPIRPKSRRAVDGECKGQDEPRRKRRKSGLAKPQDNFNAPNVLQERLTVCRTKVFLQNFAKTGTSS